MVDLVAPVGVLNVYAGPADLKGRLGITDTTRDLVLWHLLHVASRIVEGHCGRDFYVTSGSKRFDVQDRDRVQVDDLIEIVHVEEDWSGDGDYMRVRSRKDYLLYPLGANPGSSNGVPYHSLRALRRRGELCFPVGRAVVQITGRWGYRSHFVSLDAYINNSGSQLTKASKSFKVDDDANVRAGQTSLVGNEQMFVRQVGPSVLNVERGLNGTSAVAHDDGSLLKVLAYPAEVVEATLLVAVDRWRRRDGIARSSDVAAGARDELYDPSGDIDRLLGPYRRMGV